MTGTIVFLGMPDAGLAQRAAVDDLSAYLETQIRHPGVPGMAAAVISGSEVVACGAAGVRARLRSEKVTLEDRFHLGSETKSMTATLAAILVEEGRIEWDTTLAEAIPAIAADMLPSYRSLTLRQLLLHRSGIPGDALGNPALMQCIDEFDGKYSGSPTDSRRAFISNLVKKRTSEPHDGRFTYRL